MDIVVLRRGDFKRWRRCRLKDYFSRHLRLRPKRLSIPLSIGAAVHQALGKYYEQQPGGRTQEQLVSSFSEAISSIPQDTVFKSKDKPANIIKVLQEYHVWAEKADINLRFLQSEMAFTVHLFLPDKRFIGMWLGRIDGVVQRISDGSYWVLDRKTMSQFRVVHFDSDEQFTAYIWAARIVTGLPIKGAVVDAIRKKLGTPPNIQRFWYIRADGELLSYHESILQQYMEMQATIPLSVYPNLTKECSWDCSYNRDLCPLWRKRIPFEGFIQGNYEIVENGIHYSDEEGWIEEE